MNLPRQAKPIERRVSSARIATDSKPSMTPQASCTCRTVNGVKSVWCLSGRSYHNTNLPC